MSSASNQDERVNQNLLPHLQSLEKLLTYPVIASACQTGQGVYGKVKESNQLLTWAFCTVENVVGQAVNMSAPIVSKFPLKQMDEKLVKGIEEIEIRAPIIAKHPQEIYNQAKTKVCDVVQPHLNKVKDFRTQTQQKAASLKELSMRKANEVLATQYGCLMVNSIDYSSEIAMRLLNTYFPKTDSDEEEDCVPVPAQENPALHSVQTIGFLSNKVGRRIYHNLSTQIRNLRKEDIREYVATLVAVLNFTQYVNFVNQKFLESSSSTSTTATTTTTSSSSSNDNKKSSMKKTSKVVAQTNNQKLLHDNGN